MTPRLIDLYSGIGGLSLGGVRAGFTLALSVDNDPVLSQIHKLNFPKYAHLDADVSALTGAELLSKANLSDGDLFGIVGGSPCQGFSRIGKRDQADNRNKLFVHFFRLVAESKAAFFLAENVQGILDSQNTELVSTALELVQSRYQVLKPFVINASDFGASTNRKRVFFFGYLQERCDEILLEDFERTKWKDALPVEEALRSLPRKLRDHWSTDEKAWRKLRSKRSGPFWRKIYAEIPDGVGDPITLQKFLERNEVSGCIATQHTSAVRTRFAALAEGETDAISRMSRLKRNGLCPTLRAGTSADKGSFQAVRPIHFSEPRVITPREAARLQGFPDWFRFHSTKWHSFRGIGNSVSPFVSEALFRVIISKLQSSSERGR